MKKYVLKSCGTLGILSILLLSSCTKKQDESAQIKEAESVQQTEESAPEEEQIQLVYETQEEKDKNGVIGISKITDDYDFSRVLPAEEIYFPVCEILSHPLIKKEGNFLKYSYDSKNPVLPEGPLFGKNGELIFYYEGQEQNGYFRYFNKKWDYVESPLTAKKDADYSKYIPEDFSKDAYVVYELKNGVIIEDLRNQKFQGIDLSDENNPKSINITDLSSWDSFTAENFKIEYTEDSKPLLYKNEMLWSVDKAYYAAVSKDDKFKYVGKMFTGHNIFYNSRAFLIVDSSGEILKQILIPWHMKEAVTLRLYAMAWKLGKYGEIYSLMGPEKKSVDTAEHAELIVIRNYFESFGIVDTEKLVLFKEPSEYSDSYGYYSRNTGFYFVSETITEANPVQDDKFYEVRLLDGTTGYFSGAKIQALNTVPKGSFPWK